ncbi:FGGY-family carbohydrate kinase [Paracoccus albus]|uniref:FGGY-family carbohydrate kinase n=1 Tax=Paracoccus albus TaxID=3017784 RepID=UPI0022F139DF|nr:FGGY-family carbohydrate kinase [Paracoccus albus]WBU61598.1 FGGY-family carbohydrate kinase [Paracoccus albus]
MTIILTLDLGTNGARAGIYDTDARGLIAKAESPYPTRHLPPNRAEQDPEDWWSALGLAVRAAMAEAGSPKIAAITVATFSSTVVVADKKGRPLAPAILWMDARASAEALASEGIDHPVLAYCGGSNAVEWLVPKAMWLARHEPDLWSRTEVICEALDFVNFRLTGEWAGSMMNATCKWNYDSRAREFCRDLYDQLGVPELADRLPQRIVDIGAVIGTLDPGVARDWGIDPGAIVVQGGIDAHMGSFGADCIAPGSMLLIGGTSNVHLTQVPDDGAKITGVWGPYPHALTPDLRMIEGGQVSAGSILKWLSQDIFGIDNSDLPELLDQVEKIEPADTRLLALDFWMGNRTPYRDARLRGAFLGLSLSHDRASLYRAAVTAVALGSANVISDLEAQGVMIDRIVLAGGIMRNQVWLQATIDAIGKPVGLAPDDNLTLYGNAVAAAVGLGLWPDLKAAAAALRPDIQAVDPDMDRHAQYRQLLAQYRHAVDVMKPLLHDLADGKIAGGVT